MQRFLQPVVSACGFERIELRTMTAWQDAERAMWQAAVAADPAGDPAVQSIHDEGARTLPRMEHLRRVLVTARRPA